MFTLEDFSVILRGQQPFGEVILVGGVAVLSLGRFRGICFEYPLRPMKPHFKVIPHLSAE